MFGILLAILFLFRACKNLGKDELQHYKNNWETLNLKGKVRSVEETRFNGVDKFGEIQKDGGWVDKEAHFFEENGSLKKWTTEYSDQSVADDSRVYLYAYNSKQLLTEMIERNAKTNQIKYKHIFMYDDNSNSTEHLIYYETGALGTKTVYANFKNHRPTVGNSYDGQGKLLSNEKFTYDKQGNEIECTKYDPSGNKKETTKQ